MKDLFQKQAVKSANINFLWIDLDDGESRSEENKFLWNVAFQSSSICGDSHCISTTGFHIYSSKKIYAFKLCEECLGIHSTNNDLPFRYIQAFVTLMKFFWYINIEFKNIIS